jgi:pimeloyl-ACP methyl ester carboxylesterase
MSSFDLGNNQSLFYVYTPSTNRKPTVVFVNALVGSTEMWEGFIGETLRKEGFGTLSYNFRGQADSKFNLTTELTPKLIVDDLLKLLDFVKPHRPVLVGLSIGGLFAAQAIEHGVLSEGLVLINTLRKPGQRLDWINESSSRAFALGGRQLLLDLMAPMLINPATLLEMRAAALLDDDYTVTAEQDGHMNLMRNAVSADWNFPWQNLKIPVLVMTGEHDRVFLVKEDVLELSKRIPNAGMVNFTDAGHMIPMERPEKFTNELMSFLGTFQE